MTIAENVFFIVVCVPFEFNTLLEYYFEYKFDKTYTEGCTKECRYIMAYGENSFGSVF